MPKCPFDTCILIPTYNNAGTIADVVARSLEQAQRVIVAVDGSTDDTLQRLPQSERLTVLSWKQNRGKGYALSRGFACADEMGFRYVVTLDADGQHLPEEVPLLVEQSLLHPDSIIVGCRDLRGMDMPGKARFANRFSNFWFCVQTGRRLQDTQTGMRLYPLRRICFYRWLTARYESELELLVLSAWHSVPIYEQPVRVYYPPRHERVSHFRPAYDFTRISVLNTLLCLLAILYGYPMRYARSLYCAVAFLYAAVRCRFSSGDIYLRLNRWAGWVMNHLADNRFHVIGDENLPDKPVLFVANHCSMYDILAVLALRPRTIVLAQDWVKNNPFFGRLAREAGFISAAEGMETIMPYLTRKVSEGFSVLIFPEGSRSLTGDIRRFHRGAFLLAEQLGLTIQPLLLRGTYELLNKRYFLIGRTEVSLEVLPMVEKDDTIMGLDYKQRTVIMQRYYRYLLRTHRKAVIAGAGVGGLFTAALLAHRGWRVTVLEQLPVAGGGLYSYERDGAWWLTGTHVVSGMEPGGKVRALLDELGIEVPVQRLQPDVVHGEGDAMSLLLGGDNTGTPQTRRILRESFDEGAYRFVGGTRALTDALCRFISEHGGRVLLAHRVTAVEVKDKRVEAFVANNNTRFTADSYISSLHPKQLIALSTAPVFRPATMKRILSTSETTGSFKLYLKFRAGSFPFLRANHYIMPEGILVTTPPMTDSDTFAHTMEVIAPLDYTQLRPWHQHAGKRDGLESYQVWKQEQAQQLMRRLETLFPGIGAAVETSFTSTSLTYRDDYLSPEGAMFGMSQPLGAVTTLCSNMMLASQNCLVHGFCGTVMTAQMTVRTLCREDD